MEQEVKSAQIRQFEAFDRPLDQCPEMLLYPLRSHLADQVRVMALVERDNPDVAGVALIAGAGMRNVRESDLHAAILAHAKRRRLLVEAAPFGRTKTGFLG